MPSLTGLLLDNFTESVSNLDLVSILDSVNCDLGLMERLEKREEAQALVRAMETRVEFVYLCPEDMMAVTQYNGRGRCNKVECDLPDDQASLGPEYVNELMSWAKRIKWTVSLVVNTLTMTRHNEAPLW